MQPKGRDAERVAGPEDCSNGPWRVRKHRVTLQLGMLDAHLRLASSWVGVWIEVQARSGIRRVEHAVEVMNAWRNMTKHTFAKGDSNVCRARRI